MPFALLLCNITRASSFAEMVLKSHTVREVRANISHSLAMLGPGVTLDTITEMLFIGMGSLSGIFNKLHEISVVILLIHSCRNTAISTHLLLQLHGSVHQLCCPAVSFPSFSFPCSRGSHRYLASLAWPDPLCPGAYNL